MKFILRAAILLAFMIGNASANLTMYPVSYTVSEDLTITLDENTASISGDFKFGFPPVYNRYGITTVQIPVWLPAETLPVQNDLVAFLEAFSVKNALEVPLTDHVRPLIEMTLGLRVKADGTALEYSSVAMSDYGDLLRYSQYPASYWRSGVVEARFLAPLEHKMISDREVNISVLYRQPLIKTGGRTLLFYVPFFDMLNGSFVNRSTDDYCITVQCPDGFELIPRSLFSYHEPPAATRLIITPKDRELILVELIKKGQDNSASPLDPGWLTAPRKQHGDSACRCREKSDLYLQAIYWTSNNPLATINGENCWVGNRVRDFRIIKITPTNVIFRCPEGESFVLEMP